MTGRPSMFTQAIADEICERLSDGESLRAICRDERMPAKSSVFKWLAETPAFSDQYARAREAQADALFDEILDVADDARNDWMERLGEEDGDLGWKANGDHIQRAKLRVDARKWMASKLAPKKYGDKVTNIHEGGDKPIEMSAVTDRERAKAVALLARKAQNSAGS